MSLLNLTAGKRKEVLDELKMLAEKAKDSRYEITHIYNLNGYLKALEDVKDLLELDPEEEEPYFTDYSLDELKGNFIIPKE
jgi:hypothetical protein